MSSESRVLRHSWMFSCLAVAACGASYGHVAAVQPANASPGGYGYEPARAPVASYEPAHASAIADVQPVPERPGLGTTFGESVYEPIHYTPFLRASDAP